MVEDKDSTATTKPLTDEEARLRDRLQGKKVEAKLKQRLMAKKERRGSEGSAEMEDRGKNDAANSTAGDSKKSSPGSKKGSPSGNNGGSVHSRSGNGRRDRQNSSSMDRHNGRRGRPPYGGRDDGFHRGGRGGGPGGWGGPRAGPYYPEPDRFGRVPPGVPGHYPPAAAVAGGRGMAGFVGPPGPYGHGPPPAAMVNGRGGPPPFYDDYGRAPRRYHGRSRSRSLSRSRGGSSSRSRSRSPSRSVSRSRSRSLSRSPISDDDRRPTKRSRGKEDRGRGGRRRKARRRRRRSRSPSTSSNSFSSSSSSSSSEDESDAENDNKANGVVDTFTKDQRTVFVNQLVQRTTAKDIKRYFTKKVGAKVNEVILLKDKRTGKHKGCAYVEMKSMEDVGKALGVSGQAPDWQRFPVLVKPSEAEKNYIVPASTATVTANMMGESASAAPMVGPDGKPMEAQKVYIGNLDPSITKEHLYSLFKNFGDLQKVSLQKDPATGISKGFAFLSFHDPKEAHLAIASMANQVLAGRGIKTGWATLATAAPGVKVVTSDEFPEDASVRAHKAQVALTQLSLGAGVPTVNAVLANPAVVAGPGLMATGVTNKVPTVAEARQSLATSLVANAMAAPMIATNVGMPTMASLVSPDAKIIGRAATPTEHLLIRNMFDKDEETEPNWQEEIKEEFKEECSKFGKIEHVLVMHNDPGGKIYASFDTIEAAKTCASNLAGRWFDKKQLRVEFVNADDIPEKASDL